MIAAVEAGWTPPWWVLLIVVVGYVAGGALLFVGFLFCSVRIEQGVRARMALASSGPGTASMQERRAAADLGYEDRVWVSAASPVRRPL